ncbi:MAG: hypothetical protein EOO11_10925 [Chitinophagaceae bacterium]|nr:MAG: hypothetical protein EOO11_10925 [Chitinophagaceae bacterium]
MRALTAILSLLLLLLTMSGRSFVFRLRLAEARASMRQQIRQGSVGERVTVFRFSETEERALHWLEDGREFDLGAKRYDVLAKNRQNGRLVVHCVADEAEGALVAEHFRDGRNASHGPAQQLIKLLQQPFTPFPEIAVLPPMAPVANRYPIFSESLRDRARPVPTPPPQAGVVFLA